MPITINGSGTVTGISAGGLPDDSIVTADIANGAVTQAKRSEQLTLDTVKNSTSGTSINFTSIPSWVKRVTVMFNGVSTNGSSAYQIQLGDSGGIETSGYDSSVGSITSTSGLLVCSNLSASTLQRGISTICLYSGNTWVSSGCVGADGGNLPQSHVGVKTLSATLDRLSITTVNGTDTFDAGSINIMYE